LGGNSSNGENKYLISPWRALLAPAKYWRQRIVAISNRRKITGCKWYPEFDETQLTFAPDERVFYKNNWQEEVPNKEIQP
jgi:hypothetical protein